MKRKSEDPKLEQRLAYIGEIIIEYYNQISLFNPSPYEFNLWLNSLNEPYKTEFLTKGLKNCLDQMNFVRFVLELHDFGMNDFMKSHLSEEDYNFWKFNP